MTIPVGPLALWASSPVIHRHPANPLLTAQDVPLLEGVRLLGWVRT